MEFPGLLQALGAVQSPTLTLSTGRLPPQILQLKLGQTLLAQVISASRDGHVTLSIDNATLRAQTSLQLLAGQSLRVTVAETGKQTVLKLAQPAAEAEILLQALRQAAPKQQPLQPLLTALRDFVQQTATKTPAQHVTAGKTAPSTPPDAARPAEASKPTVSQDVRAATPSPATAVLTRSRPEPTAPAQTASDDSAPMPQRSASQASVSVNNARLFKGKPPPAGERLTAKVVNVKADGTATLSLNHQVVKMKVPRLSLMAGQSVTLRVAPSSTAGTTTLVAELPHVDEKKRLPLARTDGEKMHAGAADAVKTSGKPPLPLRSQLTQLVKDLFGALPTRQQLATPEGFKRALLDCGVFFENGLAKALKGDVGHFRPQDFKASLLRLVDHVKGQVSEVTRHHTGDTRLSGTDMQQVADLTAKGESALSRVQTNQVSSLMATDDGKSVLVADLPVRHENGAEVIKCRIEREPRRNGENGENRTYSVTLSFDIGDLGPMHARVLVLDQQVSVGLWAETPSTVELVNQHLTDLSERLEQAGLNPGNLGCQKGRPNIDENPPLPRGILDIEA